MDDLGPDDWAETPWDDPSERRRREHSLLGHRIAQGEVLPGAPGAGSVPPFASFRRDIRRSIACWRRDRRLPLVAVGLELVVGLLFGVARRSEDGAWLVVAGL